MTFTPKSLGENLAHLVWASFSDYLEGGALPELLTDEPLDPDAPGLVMEELLIYFLWIHTRACQQGIGVFDAEALKDTLDAMHRTVFEDLEAHGTPRDELPLIEQRVSARYSEYYSAADGDDETVGEVAARWISGRPTPAPRFSAALAHAAIIAAGPLRDFLEEVEFGDAEERKRR